MQIRHWITIFVFGLTLADAQAVQYYVTFEGDWSAVNHPNAYPGPSAHFSAPIGVAHQESVSFWGLGEPATQGIENVAEVGANGVFRDELATSIAAGNAVQVAEGSSFNSPGSQRVPLEILRDFSRVTMVAMIAPSPDWFVGVSGLELHDGVNWIDEVTVELHPYDAGTEDGNVFSTSNPSSDPRGVITRLDEDASSVLFESAPFGTFRFELQPQCDFNLDGACNRTDLDGTTGLYSVGDLVQGVDVTRGVNSKFDLTDDGRVDGDDLDAWLANAADHNGFTSAYLKGDTNLNDHVGFGDFTELSSNFGTGTEWGQGNYRGSGVTSFPDFLLLSQNFGESIQRKAELQGVPEGSSNLTLLFAIFSTVSLRRRRIARIFT